MMDDRTTNDKQVYGIIATTLLPILPILWIIRSPNDRGYRCIYGIIIATTLLPISADPKKRQQR